MVECSNQNLYTGITIDLNRRIKQHNGLIPGGAKYTKNLRPVKLVFYERCKNRSEALKREIKIKKLNRKDKEKLRF